MAPVEAGEETEGQENTQLDAAPSATPPPPQASVRSDGKPWARLVGIGPTAEVGIFDLIERQVVVGNWKKNPEAPIRINDPRIRYLAPPSPPRTPPFLPLARLLSCGG